MNTNPNPNTVHYTLTASDGSSVTWSNVPVEVSEEVGIALLTTCGLPDILITADGSDATEQYQPIFKLMQLILELGLD